MQGQRQAIERMNKFKAFFVMSVDGFSREISKQFEARGTVQSLQIIGLARGNLMGHSGKTRRKH